MLGDFSSYIEFLSAVYVTTCLNNDIFKKFWSPNFYVGFNNILSEFRFEGSSILFKNIGDIIRKKHEIIEDKAQKRGAFMLFLCIMLLAIIGFENDLNADRYSISFFNTSILTCIILAFQKFFLSKWKRVALSCILVILFSFFIYYYEAFISEPLPSINFLYERPKLILIFIISFPILYLLVVNWIFSSAYCGYIRKELMKENEIYENVLKGNIERNKDTIHPEYYRVISDACFEGKGDESITLITDVLSNRLQRAASPSIIVLINSWFGYKLALLFNRKSKEHLSGDSNNSKSNIRSESIKSYTDEKSSMPDYSKQYADYIRQKRLNLHDYCSKHSIDYKQMHAWITLYRPKHTKKR